MAFYKGKQGKWITTKTGNHVFIENGKSVEEVLTELYGETEEYTEDFDEDEPEKFDGESFDVEKEIEPEKIEIDEDDSKSLKEAKKIRRVIRKLNLTDEDIYNELKNTGCFDDIEIDKLSDKQRKKLFIAYKILLDKNIILDSYRSKLLNRLSVEYGHFWKDLGPKLIDPETFNKSLESKIEFFKNQNDILSVSLLNQIKDLQEYKDYINAFDGINKYEKYVNKYADFSKDIYSQKKKNDAFWAKNDMESEEKFKPYFDKTYDKLTQKEKKMIEKYTGTFSYINEPLRNLTYSGPTYKKESFVEDVKLLTKAIDKSKYDFDVWVQRGTNDIDINGNSINNIKDLQSLVGTSFKDHGFLSCGSHKQGGFSHKNIIMNIYCPKGTKMMWIKPMSAYKNEDETIIQRGYTYKITKIEKNHGHIYIDVDCVLGSDENKHNDDKLKELQNTKFY